MSNKIEVYIDGEKQMERELKYVNGLEALKTINMLLDYGEFHRGSKIKMLKGLQGLR